MQALSPFPKSPSCHSKQRTVSYLSQIALLLSFVFPQSTWAKSTPTSFWPAAEIKVLENESARIQQELTQLPPKELRNMNGFLGFHSALVPKNDTGQTLDSVIEFKLQKDMGKHISTIALMPASNPRDDTDVAYGFPRRFRIELHSNAGEQPIKTYNFTESDYTEERLTPFILTDIDTTAEIVRIIVERGVVKDGWEYFALGEVFIFCDGNLDTRVNIAPYSQISTTDSFESNTTWNTYYLKDRITAFNMPLGPKTKEKTDFVAVLPIEDEEEAEIQLVIDLETPSTVGRIEFYPAKPPWQISLPHFGYPGNIIVETFQDDDFNAAPVVHREIAHSWDQTRSIVLGDIYFSVPIYSNDIRYVRITFSELPIHGSSRMFAMGEISVLISGYNASHNKPISVSGITQHGIEPALLVDNYAYNREIIHPETWLIGLAKRHERESRLHNITGKLDRLYIKKDRIQNTAIFLTLTIAASWISFMYIRTRLSRHRELKQIRDQISRDLHDDVGSSIGAFGLGMERLRNHELNPAVDKVTQDLRVVAKEAAVALRESVWLTKQDSISLRDLGKMIRDRALFILGNDRVICEMEETLPDFEVSLIHKRNIMLLFKEAMHNFIKHAKTETLQITFRKGRDNSLVLQIEDEGVGIKNSTPDQKGWGLSTMETRAKQMGGELTISSTPESGTMLELRVPIATLRRK